MQDDVPQMEKKEIVARVLNLLIQALLRQSVANMQESSPPAPTVQLAERGPHVASHNIRICGEASRVVKQEFAKHGCQIEQ